MAVYLIIFGAAVLADGSPSGTLVRRVEGAVRAARSYRDPVFMPTGGKGTAGYVEAEVMRAMLLAAGVPADRIVEEGQARDTVESVRLCDVLLRLAGDVDHVLTCTSRYHLPRCVLLLRLLGWPVRVPQMPQDYVRLPTGKLIRFTLKEIVATPYDAMLLTLGQAFRGWRR